MHDLLTFREALKVNLSSKQIITILNTLINSVAEPLFLHCGLFRQLILQSMLQTQVDHRRKISVHNKERTAALVVYGVVYHDYEAIRLCELDRGILFLAICKVMEELRRAVVIERKLIRRPQSTRWLLQQAELASYLGCDINLLTVLARRSETYLNLYLQFKEYIIAKYIKLSRREANRALAMTGLHVDVNDLFKNYLLSLEKGIDKCDANSGTLTSYIMQWMMSARSSPEFDHQYGVAYKLPANVRKQYEIRGQTLNNMSTTLDEKHFEIAAPDDDTVPDIYHDKVLLRCLRQMPGSQMLFLLLDIPIVLDQSEIDAMRGLNPANGKVTTQIATTS